MRRSQRLDAGHLGSVLDAPPPASCQAPASRATSALAADSMKTASLSSGQHRVSEGAPRGGRFGVGTGDSGNDVGGVAARCDVLAQLGRAPAPAVPRRSPAVRDLPIARPNQHGVDARHLHDFGKDWTPATVSIMSAQTTDLFRQPPARTARIRMGRTRDDPQLRNPSGGYRHAPTSGAGIVGSLPTMPAPPSGRVDIRPRDIGAGGRRASSSDPSRTRRRLATGRSSAHS